jgi:hypothetical protein
MPKVKEVKQAAVNIAEAALAALEKTAGLRGRLMLGAVVKATEPGLMVCFTEGNKKYRYAVEVKNADRPAVLGAIHNTFEGYTLPGLLVAPYITAEMAEHCRKNGIEFLDTAGNAWLKAEGLRVFVVGRKRKAADMPAAKFKANTAAGMKVVFALLCRPELLNANYREIAKAAGVALGVVGGVFYGLLERRQLAGDGRQTPRRFVAAGRLVEEWVLNYPDRLRAKLAARRFAAADTAWWGQALPGLPGALWGGEVAAEAIARCRRPGAGLLYLKGVPTALVAAKRLRAAADGNLEIVEKFWNFEGPAVGPTVPPLLVYADLLATADPRNFEAAKLVYERYLANAYGKAR